MQEQNGQQAQLPADQPRSQPREASPQPVPASRAACPRRPAALTREGDLCLKGPVWSWAQRSHVPGPTLSERARPCSFTSSLLPQPLLSSSQASGLAGGDLETSVLIWVVSTGFRPSSLKAPA